MKCFPASELNFAFFFEVTFGVNASTERDLVSAFLVPVSNHLPNLFPQRSERLVAAGSQSPGP